MSTLEADQYLGLPIPSGNEYDLFNAYLERDHPTGGFAFEDLYEYVSARCPFLSEIIELDQGLFIKKSEEGRFTPAEIDEFCNGIEAGYEFMVSCLTYIYYLRSGKDSLASFLANLGKDSPELPARKLWQRKRMGKVMCGLACLDRGVEEKDYDSSDLGWIDAGDYLNRAKYMRLILEDEEADLSTDAEDAEEAESFEDDTALMPDTETAVLEGQQDLYVEGFWRGVENTIEMYIQSNEGLVIRRLKKEMES